jgi:hypothetical protein
MNEQRAVRYVDTDFMRVILSEAKNLATYLEHSRGPSLTLRMTRFESTLLVNETGGLHDYAVSDEDTVGLSAGVTAESISRVHAE